MKRLRKATRRSPSKETLQAWEDMRAEVLHEVQDGGAVQDEQIESASILTTLSEPRPPAGPPAAVPSQARKQ